MLAVLVVAAGGWYALAESRGDAGEGRPVRLLSGGRVLLEGSTERLSTWPVAELRRWLARIPVRRVRRVGAARVTLALERRTLLRRVRREIAAGGGDVLVPERPVSARTRVPLVRQKLRNNCETAALSMLLAVRGKRRDQLTLQRQLPRSAPLDPRVGPGGLVWGDPTRGFVGRADGGGPAGGYGVYERPIDRLARRVGVSLRDLSRKPPSSVYRSLLRGRPVMAWVGLSDGPLKRWRTPAGREVLGNFGEHTVVLTGLDGDRLAVNDPLTGRRLQWTRARFELMWSRLARKALGA